MIDIKSIKQEIEQKNPLILNLTNLVTMDFMANALLALGVSPIMSNDCDDAVELLSSCQAININIGTLNQDFINMVISVAQQNNKIKPLILDPVGCGASTIRTKTSQQLLPYCTTLRGNTSEIMAISSSEFRSQGVDSVLDTSHPFLNDVARTISQEYGISVAISGQKDVVYFQNLYQASEFGTPLMTKITGMGCVLTSIIASFNVVIPSYFEASCVAIMFYNLCGELAIKRSSSPAMFKDYFIDTIFSPDYDFIQQQINNISLRR